MDNVYCETCGEEIANFSITIVDLYSGVVEYKLDLCKLCIQDNVKLSEFVHPRKLR